MALTRITKGVIKPNENYDTHNINSTGIVTAVGANFTGNVSVGGVLTYEDVTSIDSVGIITSQSDIHVGGGVSAVGVGTFGSLDISGDIDVDGHTNLDNVSVAGVTTFSEDVTFVGSGSYGGNIVFDKSQGNLEFADGSEATFGNGADLRIFHNVGYNYFRAGSSNSEFHFKDNASGNIAKFKPLGNNELYFNKVKKFETTNTGIKVFGTGDGHGILLDNSTYRNNITGESNRPGAVNSLLELDGKWNNTQVSFIALATGDDTTNKDDGRIRFFTKPSGGTISERVRIEPDGKIFIGGGTSRSLGWEHLLQVEHTNSTPHGISIVGNRANEYGPNLSFAKTRSSSLGGNTIVQDNDTLAQLVFRGADGVDLANISAMIGVVVDGTPAENNVPGAFEIYTGGLNKRLTIDSSGRVLIGTTTEGHANADDLTIATSGTGGITIRTGTSNSGSIYFSDATSGTAEYAGFVGYSHANNSMIFGTNGAEKLRIMSNGYFGFGINSPSRRIHVHTSGSGSDYMQFTNDTTGTTSGDGYVFGISGDEDVIHNNLEATNMRFYTPGAERLRITSGGAVGINETAPAAQLHVENDNANASTYYLNTDAAVLIQNKNSNASAKTVLKLEVPVGGGDCALVYGDSATNLIFADRQNERLRIDSAGRLLVGTTSNVAGGAINSKIQVRSASYDAAIAIVANRSNTAGGNL